MEEEVQLRDEFTSLFFVKESKWLDQEIKTQLSRLDLTLG
jgi:hypothetical protein